MKVRATIRRLGHIAKAVTQRAGKCRSHCQVHSCRWGLGSWLAGFYKHVHLPNPSVNHSWWQKNLPGSPCPPDLTQIVHLAERDCIRTLATSTTRASRLPAPPPQGREWKKWHWMFNPKKQYLAWGGRESIFTRSLIQPLISEWMKHPLHMGAVLVLRIQQ